MTANDLVKSLEERLVYPQIDLRHLSAEEQYACIMARVATVPEPVVTASDLLKRLQDAKAAGKGLRIKFGIDPTGPEIHLGHAVSLINLRLFQRMGHKVVLVIGDFTGMIGDPSGASESRAALTEEDIRRNMATYEDQAAAIIDLKDPSVERHYNSEWMAQLSVRDWVKITQRVPVSSLLQREDFRKRLESGQGMALTELEYALFMGYDSVVLEPDLEMGGLDQFLNMHMCRQLMTNAGQRPEIIVAYNLLGGTTGETDSQGRFVKMSKSKKNYIPVKAPPDEMYGKVMSVPDEVMWVWFRELTEATPNEIRTLRDHVASGSLHPKAAKQLLARAIVGQFNHFDPAVIAAAEATFNSKFGKSAALVPEDTQTVHADAQQTLVEVLSAASGKSRSELRRIAQQSGVRTLQGDTYVATKVEALAAPVSEHDGAVFRIGKLFVCRIQIKSADKA